MWLGTLRYCLLPTPGFSLGLTHRKPSPPPVEFLILILLCFLHFLRWALGSNILRPWEHAASAREKIRNKHSHSSSPDFFLWAQFISRHFTHLFILAVGLHCGARGHSLAAARGLRCHSACGSFLMELTSPAFLFLFYFKMADIFCQE